MRVNISDVLKDENFCLEVEYNGKVEGLENPVNGYALTENVNFKGSITRLKGLLNLTGTLKFCYDVTCYRCLDNIHRSISINVDENIFNASNVSPREDVFTYEGYYLNMDIILRNYIVLNLPMKQICSEECKGLCPACGKNLNDGKCCCSEEKFVNVQMEV
jgi:uncharacterized protein